MTARRETDAFTGVAALLRQAQHKLSDVPGYADKLQGEDRNILSFDLAQEPIRPGITGPASLKYRDEEERQASLRLSPEGKSVTDWQGKVYDISKSFPLGGDLRRLLSGSTTRSSTPTRSA